MNCCPSLAHIQSFSPRWPLGSCRLAALCPGLGHCHSLTVTQVCPGVRRADSDSLSVWLSSLSLTPAVTFKALNFDWYARVHRERTVRKGRLMDSVGQALQGSNSCSGSSILEGIPDFSPVVPDFSPVFQSSVLDCSRLFCGLYASTVPKNYAYRRLEA
jgi:hypothetical protein